MRFAAGVLAAVRGHVRSCFPQECCGLLLGHEHVERAVPSRNLSERPACSYQIDPLLHLACELQERRGGPRVLGFYHSHPQGDSLPSARDRAEAQPGYYYLIASCREESLYWSGPSGWKARQLEEVS